MERDLNLTGANGGDIKFFIFFFSSRRRHTRWPRDWSSDVCSSDLEVLRACTRTPKTCLSGQKSDGESLFGLSLLSKADPSLRWERQPKRSSATSHTGSSQDMDAAEFLSH